jgi:hypothetical protein
MKLGLPGLLAMAGLAFQAAGPAGAAIFGPAGAMTGWEDASNTSTQCGFPQSGFQFSKSTFYFRDVRNGTTQVNDVVINIGQYVAAPQGAAPGPCQTPLAMTPAPVPITSATVAGTACTLNGGTTDVPDSYTRVNNEVSITFNCGGAVWQLTGTQNICETDPLGLGVPPQLDPSPECNVDPNHAGQEDGLSATAYNDPVVGGAGSHFIVAYAHT